MGNLGSYEIQEGTDCYFNFGVTTADALTECEPISTSAKTVPDVTDLSDVDTDGITPQPSALNYNWEPDYTSMPDYPGGRILIYGKEGNPRATAPFETLTITDNDGNTDTLSIKVYEREFTEVRGDYEVINYRLLNEHDYIILPNTGPKLTQYLSQGWEAPTSQDPDVVEIQGNRLVAVGEGTARIDWGRHRFNVEVSPSPLPMGYKINDGFAVMFYNRNVFKSFDGSFDTGRVTSLTPQFTVRENPQNTVTHDTSDRFGDYIRYNGNEATPWTVASVEGIIRGPAPQFQTLYHFVLYTVLLVVDREGNDPTVRERTRPLPRDGFPLPPLGFDDILGGQINYDVDPVPPARILAERLLPEDNNGNIRNLPPKPDDNFKRLAMGLSSKTYLTTDISFEDQRKINQTPTIFKEGGHFDFAEKLPRQLTVVWPAVRGGPNNEILDTGLFDEE